FTLFWFLFRKRHIRWFAVCFFNLILRLSFCFVGWFFTGSVFTVLFPLQPLFFIFSGYWFLLGFRICSNVILVGFWLFLFLLFGLAAKLLIQQFQIPVGLA